MQVLHRINMMLGCSCDANGKLQTTLDASEVDVLETGDSQKTNALKRNFLRVALREGFGWQNAFTASPCTPGLSGSGVYRCKRPLSKFSKRRPKHEAGGIIQPGNQVDESNARLAADVCVKELPKAFDVSAAELIHQVMRHAKSSGCEFIPTPFRTVGGKACFSYGDSHWEMWQWMPGEHLSEHCISVVQRDATNASQVADYRRRCLVATGAAIAKFHASVESFDGSNEAIERAGKRIPAIESRIERIDTLNYFEPYKSLLKHGLRPASMQGRALLTQAIDFLRTEWTARSSRLRQLLIDQRTKVTSLQWCLRDIHCENVLLSQQNGEPSVTGVIDLDATRIDTIATDIGRLAGSVTRSETMLANAITAPPEESKFGEWRQAATLRTPNGILPVSPQTAGRLHAENWDAVLAGYRSIRSLSEREEILARLIAETTDLVAIANWVVWLAIEKRSFHVDFGVIHDRISDLLLRVQFAGK